MTYKEYDFAPCDIGLSTDNSWLGNSIKFFQSMWTRKAEYSHAFAFTSSETIVEALVRITESPKAKYENRTIKVYRISVADDERIAFAKGMSERINGAYGWDKYPLFFLDAITTWTKRVILRQKAPCFWFTKTFKVSNIPVCSQLVVWGLYKFTSYRLRNELGKEVPWTIVTPDYLDDLLKLPINNARVCYQQEAR
jgi:hypothetical protein